MEDYLTMPQLAERLHEAAHSIRSGPLLVRIDVPFSSEYRWTDDYGAPRTVHLPIAVHVLPAEGGYHRESDDAYVFELAGEGAIDVRSIYPEAIAWAQRHYGSGEGSPELPALPTELVETVQQLLG